MPPDRRRFEVIDPGVPGHVRPLVRLLTEGECEHPVEACASGVCAVCGQEMIRFRIQSGAGPRGEDLVVYQTEAAPEAAR